MRINNNIMALDALNNYNHNWSMQIKSFEKLSSGLRINRASDDPSSLAISEKLRAQVRGLNQANRNAQDGISLLTVAEGALNETHAILHRIRELSIQSATDTLTTADRTVIQVEVDMMVEEIDRIAMQTQFNTKELISDSPFNGFIHIGANSGQTMAVNLNDMTAAGIGVDSLDLSDNTNSEAAIETIDDAMMLVSVERGAIGASTIRLEHVINVNTINAENTQAAESRLRDVDMAREMMNFMKNSILMQSAQAMIAQANQFPNLILQLLR